MLAGSGERCDMFFPEGRSEPWPFNSCGAGDQADRLGLVFGEVLPRRPGRLPSPADGGEPGEITSSQDDFEKLLLIAVCCQTHLIKILESVIRRRDTGDYA